MNALAGSYTVAAALLVLAGILEVHRPDSTVGALRALGVPARAPVVRGGAVVGVVIGIGALVVGGGLVGTVFAGLLAAVYLAFAVFIGAALARRTPLASCGCFGRPDTPPSITHLVLDLAAVAVAIGVAIDPGEGVSGAIAAQPAAGIPFLLFTAVGGFLVYLAFTALPRALAAARRTSWACGSSNAVRRISAIGRADAGSSPGPRSSVRRSRSGRSSTSCGPEPPTRRCAAAGTPRAGVDHSAATGSPTSAAC